MKYLLLAMMFLSLSAMVAGCDRGPTQEDLGLSSPEVEFGKQVRGDVESLHDALRSEGPVALRQQLTGTLENYTEGGVDPPEGQEEAYNKIVSGLKELEQMFAGANPSRAQLQTKLQELTALAQQLPGEPAGDAAATK